jgi:hypothetical protein
MEAILVDYTVAHDVVLCIFAAVICFRSLNIMPGVERGIANSQRHAASHNTLQNYLNKVEKFMVLPEAELPGLINTLSFQYPEQYISDIPGTDPSFRLSLDQALSENLSFRHPLNAVKVICLGILTVVAVACVGIDRLEGRRRFPDSQSRKMTVFDPRYH